MNTCVLCFKRRNALECTTRSRSRWNGVRWSESGSDLSRLAGYERAARGESDSSSSRSIRSRKEVRASWAMPARLCQPRGSASGDRKPAHAVFDSYRRLLPRGHSPRDAQRRRLARVEAHSTAGAFELRLGQATLRRTGGRIERVDVAANEGGVGAQRLAVTVHGAHVRRIDFHAPQRVVADRPDEHPVTRQRRLTINLRSFGPNEIARSAILVTATADRRRRAERERGSEDQRREPHYPGSGGRVNQSQPTGSVFVSGSHVAHGNSGACFWPLP